MSAYELTNMDVRLWSNSVFQIVGPSGCGKTLFTVNLLLRRNEMFRGAAAVRGTIHWLMGASTDGGEQGDTASLLSKLKPDLKIYREGPWDKVVSLVKGCDCIVIDDLFTEAQHFTELFTKVARHRNVTVIFITQNMFHQGGQHRTRNLNVHYLVLFKNPRDQTVIDYVARQAYPNNKRFLIDAYHDATNNKPHGYLFIDFTQSCPDEIRVRTDIFSDGEYQSINKLFN